MNKELKERIDNLYKKKFQLEEKGKKKEAKKIKERIQNIIMGKEDKRIDTSEMEIIKESELKELDESEKVKYEFFYKTRKKAFHKNLRNLIEKFNPDDIELALGMTSMLTHSLIEMQKEGKSVYTNLDINILIETVSNFLKGDLSNKEVLEIIDEHWTDYLLTKVEKEGD